MYKVIKSVIESKRYELAEMLIKIDTFWVQGDITKDEYEELVDLARIKALPENSYIGLQQRVDVMYKELEELKARVKALESTGEEGNPEEPEDELVDEYPEYVAPTGAHDAYHAGMKVKYNGVNYICVAPEGTAVVWSPDVMPSYWEKVTETVAE